MRPYDHAPVVHCSSLAKSDARSNSKDIGPRHSSLSRGEKHRTSMEAQDCRPRVLSRRKKVCMKRFDRCRVVFRHAGARSFLGTASGYRLMPDSNLRTCAVVPGTVDRACQASRKVGRVRLDAGHVTCDSAGRSPAPAACAGRP